MYHVTICWSAVGGNVIVLLFSAGQLNVWKQGTGTWALTGANTYTGTTTVSSGTLLADGSITSATIIMTGAVLGGNGRINATVNNAGTISPGDVGNAGTLTITSLTLGNASSLNFILNTPDSTAGVGGNSLLATTDLTLGSGIIVNISGGSQFGVGIYHLISFSDAINNLADLNSWVVNGPTGYRYTLSDPVGIIDLNVTAVPEPPVSALLFFGGLMLLLRKAKRRPAGSK